MSAANSTYIALIRGINVGGHKKLSMADLKSACESLGYTDVRTLLNTGNVIFHAAKRPSPADLEKKLGIDVRVILRTPAELAKAIENSPLKGKPNRLMLMFLESAPKKKLSWDGPEQTHLDGRHLYLYYPDGQATTKLTNVFIERQLGVAGTTRNWNTVTKLLALTHPKG
jgi:uncharacterized protein (DUF1697 family)